MSPAPLPIDPGLLARFREAGARIAWRPGPAASRGRKGAKVRLAHLHDEEARSESWGSGRSAGVVADSGPLGALILLLEADRRGPPDHLASWNAGTDPGYPQGAVVAAWGPKAPRSDSTPRLSDLVELARYALA
jgi:hypothetical protein